MPTYRNTGTESIWLDGIEFKVGKDVKVSRYYDVSTWTMLTLVTDEALDPIVEIYKNSLPMTAQSPLCEYDRLVVRNRTDDVATITVNGNETFTLAAGEGLDFVNNRQVYKLAAAGSGSGDFVLQGIKTIE